MVRRLLALVGSSLPKSVEVPTSPGPVRWGDVARLALDEGLAGWLARSGALAGAGEPTGEVDRATRGTRARNMILLAELGKLARACKARGIPLVALKGAALLLVALRDPGLRAMKDLDVLVPREHAPRLRALAVGLGYSHLGPARAPSRLQHTKQDLVARKGSWEVRLEIHTTLDGLGLMGPTTREILSRATRVDPGLLVPSLEDMALHVAIHWSTDGFPHRLRDWVDLVTLWAHGLDPDEVVDIAARTRALPVWDTLVHTLEQFAPLPFQAPREPKLPRTWPMRLPLIRGWAKVRTLLMAPGPAALARTSSRVALRRIGDAWARLFEGGTVRASPGHPTSHPRSWKDPGHDVHCPAVPCPRSGEDLEGIRASGSG